jgi:hypothetical protein
VQTDVTKERYLTSRAASLFKMPRPRSLFPSQFILAGRQINDSVQGNPVLPQQRTFTLGSSITYSLSLLSDNKHVQPLEVEYTKTEFPAAYPQLQAVALGQSLTPQLFFVNPMLLMFTSPITITRSETT